jgi:hypothetical protein
MDLSVSVRGFSVTFLTHRFDQAYLIVISAFTSKRYSSRTKILPDKGALGVSEHGYNVFCSRIL